MYRISTYMLIYDTYYIYSVNRGYIVRFIKFTMSYNYYYMVLFHMHIVY